MKILYCSSGRLSCRSISHQCYNKMNITDEESLFLMTSNSINKERSWVEAQQEKDQEKIKTTNELMVSVHLEPSHILFLSISTGPQNI